MKPGGLNQSAAIASTDVMFVTGNMGCASGGPINAWRTEDGGKTWQSITGPNTPLRVVVANTQLVYGTTCTGVVQSTDNGATWTVVPGSQVTNYDPGGAAIGAGWSFLRPTIARAGSLKVMKSAGSGSGSAWTDVTPKNAGELRAPAIFAVAPTTEGHPEQGGIYIGHRKRAITAALGGGERLECHPGQPSQVGQAPGRFPDNGPARRHHQHRRIQQARPGHL